LWSWGLWGSVGAVPGAGLSVQRSECRGPPLFFSLHGIIHLNDKFLHADERQKSQLFNDIYIHHWC
ncbi:hypothetical protein COCCADRAFT_101475, partial [Bipolaris zeicola 26-R-13]